MIALGSTPIASSSADRLEAGQQDNVYSAENGLNHGRKFDSLHEVQDFVDSLTASDWWFAPQIRRVEVSRLRSTKWAGVGNNCEECSAGSIALTTNGQDELTILHEVAHCITHKGGGHGPEWVQNYMKLVFHVMDAKAYPTLYAAFKNQGVLFD